MPNALEELCKLTGVERPEEIGENGPAVGARATEANAGEVGDLFPKLLETTAPSRRGSGCRLPQPGGAAAAGIQGWTVATMVAIENG